jgi:hypothetical protein
MTLQEFIAFDQFVRCYCIGQEEVMIMPYDPRKPYLSGEQYIQDPNYLTPELAERITNDVRTLCRALGYDINTVEFAIKDGIPYAIDFMNPAPDAELASVGEFYHNWVTDNVVELVFKRLAAPQTEVRYRWDAMLNPRPLDAVETPTQAMSAVASAVSQAVPAIIPESGREIASDIAAGVTDLVEGATNAVSEFLGRTSETEASPEQSAKPSRAAATKTPKAATPRKGASKSVTPRTKKTPEV